MWLSGTAHHNINEKYTVFLFITLGFNKYFGINRANAPNIPKFLNFLGKMNKKEVDFPQEFDIL